MAKHIAGGKITDTHSSIIDAAIPLVKLIQKQPEVSKIVLGPITQGLRPAPHRIKVKPITGGINITVRGSATKQELYVYTSNPPVTEETAKTLF